jgi:putative glutamine amidotransferase
MKPVIGITSYARDGSPSAFSVPTAYVDAVRAVGALPVVFPAGERNAEHLLDIVDGVILSGGGDISPDAYGGRQHETVYSVSEERDEFEFSLTRAALARPSLPMLCICRGLQLLNVVCGGTLHAHVPDAFGEDVAHRLPPKLTSRHAARIDADSRLARIVGSNEVEVCSWHHQAIDRVGVQLTPVAWAVDGVIEAVEHNGHPWCFAVQWHPEMQIDEEPQRRIFEALVQRANKTGVSC